jgi:DNA-binding NarL/FixJ family response regulator
VLDITMPRLGGIEAAHRLQSLQQPIRLVFLTVHEDPDYAQAARDAGGLGYVVKSRLASDLLPAIRAALADRSFISPAVGLDGAGPISDDLPEKPTPTHRNPWSRSSRQLRLKQKEKIEAAEMNLDDEGLGLRSVGAGIVFWSNPIK